MSKYQKLETFLENVLSIFVLPETTIINYLNPKLEPYVFIRHLFRYTRLMQL